MAKKFDEGGVVRDAQGRFVRWASSTEDQLKDALNKPASKVTSKAIDPRDISYQVAAKPGQREPKRKPGYQDWTTKVKTGSKTKAVRNWTPFD